MIFRLVSTLFIYSFFSSALVAQDAYSIFERDGRFGLNDLAGEEVISPVYEALGWSNGDFHQEASGRIGYKEDGKWGLMSTQGKRITDPVFYHLEPMGRELFKIGITQGLSNRLSFGLLSVKGKTLLSCSYFVLERVGNFFIVGQDSIENIRYGLLDTDFKELLPTDFLELKPIGALFAASPNGLQWHLYRQDGTLLSPVLYDDYKLVGDYLEVQKKGAKGLLDGTNGQLLFETKHKSFIYSGNGPDPRPAAQWQILDRNLDVQLLLNVDSVGFTQNCLIGFLNGQERIYRDSVEALPDMHFELKQVSEEFMVVQERNGGKWKAYSAQREIAKGDSIFFDGAYFHVRNRSSWNIINKYGRSITKRPVQVSKPAQELYVPVRRNDQWGIIDYQGEEVLGYAYDVIGQGLGNTFPVKYVGSWGIMNALGNWVVQPSYDSLYSMAGFYVGEVNGRLSIMSGSGVHLSVTRGQLIEKEGAVQIVNGEKRGIITPTGTVVFDPIYNQTSHKGRFYLGRREEGSVVKNSNGEFVLKLDRGYDEVYSWDEGYFHITKRGLHGFVDESGRLRVANRYDSARGFSEGKAAIKLIGKWGFINAYEELIIQPLYESVSDFRHGVAVVQNGKYGLINENGEEQLNLEFDRIDRTEQGSYILEFEGKKGLADSRGNILLSPSFDYMEDIGGDLIVVGTGGKKGIYNSNGALLKSFEYADVQTVGPYLAVRKSR